MPDQPDITIAIAGAEPGPPSGARYNCPITTCDWHYDAPAPPVVDEMALAEIFGPGVIALKTANDHRAAIERELGRHVNTHTITEFVVDHGRLIALIAGLTQQLQELGTIQRDDRGCLGIYNCANAANGAGPATNPQN